MWSEFTRRKAGKSYHCGILLQIDIVLCFPISRQGMNKFYKNRYLLVPLVVILNFSQQKDHSELCNKNHLRKKRNSICFKVLHYCHFNDICKPTREMCPAKKKKEKSSLEVSIIFCPSSIFQAFSFTKPFLNVSWGWWVGSPI